MFNFVAGIIALYILFWIFVIIIGIALLLFVIRIITAIVDGVRSSKSTTMSNINSNYEKGSIGDLLERDQAAADRGDMVALLETRGERETILKIIKWFDSKVKNGDYQAIRENDVKRMEPNYAFVMKNDSGYNFKEFSCKAKVYTQTGELPAVKCTAKDWNNGEEGYMWFYCSSRDIKRMMMEVNDIKYTISDKVIEKKTSHNPESNGEGTDQAVYTLVSAEFTEGGKRYDYIAEDSNIRVGDTVTVDVNGSPKTVRVVGVNIRKADELDLPLSRYKHILNDDQGDVMDVDFEIEKGFPEDDECHNDFDFDADFDTDKNKAFTLDEQEERERIYEPYICPECFEPYDGIYCENCGHSNDMPGEEELSEDDKFAEHFAAAWMIDQMEKEGQGRSNGIFGSGFEAEFDEDDEF